MGAREEDDDNIMVFEPLIPLSTYIASLGDPDDWAALYCSGINVPVQLHNSLHFVLGRQIDGYTGSPSQMGTLEYRT